MKQLTNSERYQLLAENMMDLVCLHDEEGKYMFLSPSCKRILGFDPDELLDAYPYKLIHPQDLERFKTKAFLPALEGKCVKPVIYRVRKKNNDYIWFETAMQVLKEESGQLKGLQTSSREITDRINAIDKLRVNEKRYSSLISVLNEGIVFLDKLGFIKVANESASKILGLSQSELLTKKADDPEWNLIYEDGTPCITAEHPGMKTLETGLPHHNVIVGLVNEGVGVKWILTNSQPIFEENLNSPSAAVVSFIDITERKKAEEDRNRHIAALQQSKKLLEENHKKLTEINKKLFESEAELIKLNEDKDKLFSLISHDLRSPFDALLGFSTLIMDEYDDLTDNEIKFYVEHINSAAKHLLNLLDNMLQWSRLQTGRMVYDPEQLVLSHVIESVIALMRGNAVNKGISLVYKNSGKNKFKVFADENMLYSILQNLISNGIKFTKPGGSVIVDCRLQDDMVKISVADSGIGMSQKKMNNLFKVAKDSSSPGTAKEKGAGIGLILSKELVETHGGKISVSSKPEGGTTFSFTIPRSE